MTDVDREARDDGFLDSRVLPLRRAAGPRDGSGFTPGLASAGAPRRSAFPLRLHLDPLLSAGGPPGVTPSAAPAPHVADLRQEPLGTYGQYSRGSAPMNPSQAQTTGPRPRTFAPVLVPQQSEHPSPAEPSHHQDVTDALAEAHRQILTLRAGLERRTVIGQAIGITMIQAGVTAEAAFADLVQRSQNANVKVRDLADEIVRAADAFADTS